jgi:hypothetical protein
MNYRNKLIEDNSERSKEPLGDEWLFERFRDSVTKSMSSSEAFEAIDVTE